MAKRNRNTAASSEEKPSLRQNLSAFRHLPKFFGLIWESSPPLFMVNIGLRLLKAGLPLAALYVGKLIIDEIVLQISQPQPSTSALWTWVGIELALALFSDLLSRGISLADALLGDLFANESSVRLMRHAALMDLAQFENATFYDKLERARRQTTGRVMLMSLVLTQIQELITVVVLGIGLVFFNVWLMLVLILTIIPAFINENYFNRSTYALAFSWTPERRELDYLRYCGASDETAKEVKIFGLAGFLTERFKVLSHQYYLANRALAIRRNAWGFVFNILSNLGYYGAYVYIIWQTLQKMLSLGDLTFLSGSFGRMQLLLQGIFSRFSSIAQNTLYLQDLFDFFDIQPLVQNVAQPKALPASIQQGFEFQDVGFKYPNSEVWAVRHLNFTLRVGEKLALVGENGAGKTTLTKLLTRLYDPDEGRILLDGVDLREYDLLAYQQMVGVIFQDFIKFQLPAKTNIAIGDIEAREDLVAIKEAAQMSLADTVIEKLPQQYEHMLGRYFADGTNLSGGEWQKIALGRAYMRKAQLIVLDEPTAALDARAEYEVFLRFTELTKGKTAVLISHRFSTVRIADRILVLQNGQMAELGTHEELLAQKGLYAELFQLQAEGYR
ncbi:MAG: ABC transporter ATP-binding protein [Microscillaceae bacterium]